MFQKIKQEGNTDLMLYVCMDPVDDPDILYYDDLKAEGRKLWEEGNHQYDQITIQPDKMTVMLFTSGTTSIAKAVMLSQKNICSNVNAMPYFVLMYDTDVLLSFLPMHHTFECTISFLYGCLYCGATIAFCDGLKYIVDNLKEYGVTVFVAVPLMLEKMYKKVLKGIDKQGKTKLIQRMLVLTNGLNKIHIDIRRKVYQPIIEVSTNKIETTEALLRWTNPSYSTISPLVMIEIAEQSGLIFEIGEWVLRQACKQNKIWQDKGYPPIVVSVNVSAIQFEQINFVEMVSEILHGTKISRTRNYRNKCHG